MSESSRTLSRPAILDLAVPLQQLDITSGAIDRFARSLTRSPAFRALQGDELKTLTALSLGYGSWIDLQKLKGPAAKKRQLPRTEWELCDAIAWRMFEKTRCNPADAIVAAMDAWRSSSLTARGLYGTFGSRGRDTTERIETGKVDFEALRPRSCGIVLDRQHRQAAIRIAGMDLIMSSRVDDALHLADKFWSPDSIIPFAELQLAVEASGRLSIDDAIEASWYYSAIWPPGLTPVEYESLEGATIGYGLLWMECGCRHARVFGSAGAFKEALRALWLREGTEQYALPSLPSKLVEVQFENPWAEAHQDVLSDEIARVIEIETRDVEDPALVLVPTNGSLMHEGVNVEFDGEPFTRRPYELRVSQFEQWLGGESCSHSQLDEMREAFEFLNEKVPFAFDQETLDTYCEVVAILSKLAEAESKYLKTPTAERELGTLVRRTAAGAMPVVARSSELWMQGTMGMVATFDVPDAGRELANVYPELAPLEVDQKGEYALGFYGKNGIRHDGSHRNRDVQFLAYAFLRNLGLDPSAHGFLRDLGELRAIRKYVKRHAAALELPKARRELEFELRAFQLLLSRFRQVEDLDQSLSSSRIQFVRDGGRSTDSVL